MDAFEQMMAARRSNVQERANALERLRASSRDRLLGIIEKKIRTTMIGALAAFEDTIGRQLWGHGKPANECTEDELFWRALWQEKVRPEVLNNGNSQLRAMQAEVALYEVLWNGYRARLTPSGPNEEGK